MRWRLGSISVFFITLTLVNFCLASHDSRFPHTQIAENLPTSIQEELPQIINYRFGVLPNSSMLTIKVLSAVFPFATYQFEPGNLKPADAQATLARIPKNAGVPAHVEFQGLWTSNYSHARPEANVLGGFGTLIIDSQELVIPLVTASPETLAYYEGLFVKSGEAFVVDSPKALPVTVVLFEANYEKGYLALPAYGGGYYLEFHDLPHFWSHVNPDGHGAIILGKEATPGTLHLTAYQIPYGAGVYVPGGVVHSDALLIGEVMPIYSVTDKFSTVHIKDKQGVLVHVRLHSATN